jgi:hypothetical protein
VIATGGLGSMIGTGSKYIKHVDDLLTLEGLRIIWERNAGARGKVAEGAPKAESKTPSKSAQPKSRDGGATRATSSSRSAR